MLLVVAQWDAGAIPHIARRNSRSRAAGTGRRMPRGQATGGPGSALNLTSADVRRRCVTSLISRVQQHKKTGSMAGTDGGDENETGCRKPLIQNENVIIMRYERQQESNVPWHMRFMPSWKLALTDWQDHHWRRLASELGSLLEMPSPQAAGRGSVHSLIRHSSYSSQSKSPSRPRTPLCLRTSAGS